MRCLLVVAMVCAVTAFQPVAARADSAALTITPAAQSAAKGAAVVVTVQVAGGSGSRQLSYVVVGRNDGTHGSVTTDAEGLAQISFRDRATGSTESSDTIAVVDPADDLSSTATVDYLDGPDHAAAVALDLSGSGFDDASCGTGRAAPADGVALARQTVVCAEITNSLGEPLAGKPVEFAVSRGAVGAIDADTPEADTTFPTMTDRAGIVFALVTSTTSGRQAVTATVDHLTGSGSISYAPPSPDQAAGIQVRPASGRVLAGRARTFVATVVDGYGNPVGGVAVSFAQRGAGSLVAPTSASPTTALDGTVTATIATRRGETGVGVLTAGIVTSPTACGTAGECSTTASYDVRGPVVPASLMVEAAPGASVGEVELVAAVVRGSDGSPVAGQIVHFAVSGSDDASGTVRSNVRGVALFGYPPQRRGHDTVRAWDDMNRDGRCQRAEPVGSLGLVVAAHRSGRRPKK